MQGVDMGYERTDSLQNKNSRTPQPTTQFGSRPFPAPVQMKPQEQQTPEELENEAFNQNKFEAFGLQLKEKSGTITPVEQEQLGVLQAKMDDFWAQRQERASRSGFDFSKVSVTPPGEPAAPQIQPNHRLETPGMPLGGQRSLFNSPLQSSASPIQRKLTIGQPGDKYEQEADQVASQVVEQINSPKAAQSTQGQSVQRQEEPEEELQAKPSISELQRSLLSPEVQRESMPEEEEIQAKSILQRQEEPEEELQAKPSISELQRSPLSLEVQREAMSEEEELQAKSILQRQEEPVEEIQAKPSISDLQRSPLSSEVQREAMPEEEDIQAKSILQRREAIAVGEASPDLDSAINSARGGGQPLDAGLQQSMGQAMGADFSGVKIHTDAQSDQLNQSIQAKAFTTGQDVFFRQGAYDPGSRGGQELIAHELTHVVQQNGGAVARNRLRLDQSEGPLTTHSHPIQKQSTLKIVQKAGDYSGLLPDHDVEKDDAYTFGQQNERKKEFTYHHIIPENILTKVYDKIKILLDKTKNTKGEQEDEQEDPLRTATEGLKSGGRKLWLDTRAKNTAYIINTNFSDYGVSVTPEQLRPLIEANTSLDTLFPAIRDFIKHKFKSVFLSLQTGLSKAIKEKLQEPAFLSAWQQKNAGTTIMNILQPFNISGKPIFNANEVEHIVHGTPYQNLNGRGTNKGELIRLIDDYAKSKTFDNFYSQSFPELVVEKKGDKNYLYTNVSEKGLPRNNPDELRDAMEWNPGNIHRGPKSSYRLDPKFVSQFEALQDDGGDSFEYAAVNLVGTEHFAKLELLSRNIPYLLQADTDNPSQGTLTLAGGIIAQMLDIQACGVTKFQESSWEKHGANKMRVKLNEDAIRAAQGITSIATLGRARGIQGI
jgi:hypothetical protein